ncbi:RING/U-box superfamily protein [Rhynchospora pubera]|uniref:RING/U-box superfamily protein n=1 Tax=Rhynchospora pubera TaxID=906938 RepID=A0AAV8H1D3_9POAL|nr:RING/U-box superfamily protein [Rhynchospora pubera]
MGIPLVSYCVAVPRPLFLLVKYLSQIRIAILVVVSFISLCLCHLPGRSNNRFHRFQTPIRVPLLPPSTIKEQLPVTEFTSIIDKLQGRKKSQSTAAKHLCIVCLENLEQCDHVRMLGNCNHAFHTECIDQWIDVGQTVCPLCRAQLLPKKQSYFSILLRLFS